uniref:Schlafen AlbA-2 domain-containing protein n=1 Tax=viral metagenome TaxID=1070528 RepID=A0A6C0AN26_9ZZZZ
MLPQLPEKWVFGEKVPFQESNTIELKRVSIFTGLFNLKSIRDSGLPKYKETIHAFLNGVGGYLIMGVLDNGTIAGGENLTPDFLDKFNLWIDSCYGSFTCKDGGPIDPSVIQMKIHTFPVQELPDNSPSTHILVVEVINKGVPLNIMNRSGAIIYRLNASNYKMITEPVYKKRDVKGMIQSIQVHMQQIIDEKHRALESIQDKHMDEIKAIVKRESNITRDYVEKISESLYEKYKIDQEQNLCGKIMRFIGLATKF